MKSIIAFTLLFVVMFVAQTEVNASDRAYHIGPGDVIEIAVWKDPELSRQLVVPPDGAISFPLIQSVQAKNLTVADLKKIVTQKLSEYIPDPTVTVMLVEINSLNAYVIGKVNEPGEFQINLETNVMQILAKAGGLTPFASKSKIIILRQKQNAITEIPFDYSDVEKGQNLDQNILLQAGDVVVVP